MCLTMYISYINLISNWVYLQHEPAYCRSGKNKFCRKEFTWHLTPTLFQMDYLLYFCLGFTLLWQKCSNYVTPSLLLVEERACLYCTEKQPSLTTDPSKASWKNFTQSFTPQVRIEPTAVGAKWLLVERLTTGLWKNKYMWLS